MIENHALFAATVVGAFLGDHEVHVCPSIDQLKRTFSSAAYDAVLVDYDLDDGKGDAAVRWLRGAGYAGTIVAISAHAEGNEALLAAGADRVCRKSDFARIAEHLPPTEHA